MYEQIGKIVIINVKGKPKIKELKELKALAKKLLSEHRHIEAIFLKQEKVKGRLRKASYKLLAGKPVYETLYRENGCTFKLNIKDVYFSSRLASNRLWLAQKIVELVKQKKKQRPKILVQFAGIGVYGIVIARQLAQAGFDFDMVMIELNRKAVKYMKENILLNHFPNIECIQGDVKKILPKLNKLSKLGIDKFDFIVMPRPKLDYDFFKEAFINAKKGSIVFYFDFVDEDEIAREKEKLEEKARKLGKKIKFLELKKAGQIGTRRWRIAAVFEVC
ncbi:MAG: hypothetical protein QW199_02040 [Candidatus Pacearchaeota archaeon]